MVDVFSVPFLYGGEIYIAVIIHKGASLSIHLPDSALHDLLPKGMVTFTKDKGFDLGTKEIHRVHQLITTILTTVQKLRLS